MSKICDLTGKKALKGNIVTFSKKKIKRRFYPNLHTKKFFLPSTGEWIVLKVSAKALRTIDKKGIEACLDRFVKEGRI